MMKSGEKLFWSIPIKHSLVEAKLFICFFQQTQSILPPCSTRDLSTRTIAGDLWPTYATNANANVCYVNSPFVLVRPDEYSLAYRHVRKCCLALLLCATFYLFFCGAANDVLSATLRSLEDRG